MTKKADQQEHIPATGQSIGAWFRSLPPAAQATIVAALIALLGAVISSPAWSPVVEELLTRPIATPVVAPTSTATSISAATQTSSLTLAPTSTDTPTPTSTPTDILTPTPTPTPAPDCEGVEIDYLDLELNSGTTRRECPITLQRSDVENLANLSGQAYLSGPSAAQCGCARCWVRINSSTAQEVSMACSEDCSFSVPISDQVQRIFMRLDLYGSVKLCTIAVTD